MTILTDTQRSTLADRLRAAERDRAPIAPLVEACPALTVTDAYRIQLFNIERRDAAVVGHKVGRRRPPGRPVRGRLRRAGHGVADLRGDDNMSERSEFVIGLGAAERAAVTSN